MGINVLGAAAQAGALKNEVNQLKSAKSKLKTYRTNLTSNWTGTEVSSMVKGINIAISEIDAAIKELNQLSVEIKNVANAIHQEEVERQNRINMAQKAYNDKLNEIISCNSVKGVLEDQIKNPSKYKLSAKDVAKKKIELQDVKKLLEQKSRELSVCQTNLQNAQRS